MLTCIACPKQQQEQLDDGSLQHQDKEADAATPRTKQAIKALTSQIKDIALKASGAYRSCKPCSSSNNKHRQNYLDSDTASDSTRFHCSYRRAGTVTPRMWGKEMESRLKVLSSGETTPASASGRTESVAFTEEDGPKEWVAQVEPGVLITFVSLPQGGNDLKRIRFSREMFNKWQAQKWWTENYDKVMELYNVKHLNHQAAPLQNPPSSEDEGLNDEPADCPVTPPLSKEYPPHSLIRPAGMKYSSSDSLDQCPKQSCHHHDPAGLASTPKVSSTAKTETSSLDGSGSSRNHSGELSVSNASDMETEWVEEDEPGVYITIRALPGGIRELRRVRFSREKFTEMHARLWWEENRARIQEQYL
ncbi:hypothetical protein SAY86_013957 [Trapa natans]|uniref:BRX domain-containing protein n=1 Tax=Trapa natans TaxID=22666 RepID=A0AAN7KRV7_TRANT|nr:hypothetical protein SAY86_013957 [Trapa natans]